MDKRMHDLKDYLSKHRVDRISHRVTTVLAAIVIFTVTYILLMPAISLDIFKAKEITGMDQEYAVSVLDCDFEIHRHNDDCYKEVDVYDKNGKKTGTEKILICDKLEAVVHTHDENCYQDVITTQADKNGNTVTTTEKVLICSLPELEEHVHDDKCYKEQKILTCGQEESKGHTHSDKCYKTEDILICGLEEHTHTDKCYSEVVTSTENVLICGREEGDIISPAVYSEPVYSDPVYDEETGDLIHDAQLIKDAELITSEEVHHHDDSCYETVEYKELQLICGKEEHTHGQECYEQVRTLTCDKTEQEGHKHTDDCYEISKELTCDKPEAEVHEHTKVCYEYKSIYNKNGKKIGKKAILICGKYVLPEHQHTEDCFKTVTDIDEEEVPEVDVEADDNSGIAEGDDTDNAIDNSVDNNIETNGTIDNNDIDANNINEDSITNAEETEHAYSVNTRNIKVQGTSYSIRVEYGSEANIPEDAQFSAIALDQNNNDYKDYIDKALDALSENNNASNSGEQKVYGLFDLTIYNSDGEPIQPAAPISVNIDFSETEHAGTPDADSDVFAVHFPGTMLVDGEVVTEGKTEPEPEIIDATVDNDNVMFDTDGLSMYVIVGTTIEKTVLASDGHNYKITATYGAETGIPEGAELEVTEVTSASSAYGMSYEEYVAYTENALGIW